MKIDAVRYVGKTISLELTNGKVYKVLSIERGRYRIVDDTGEDYLSPAGNFEVVAREEKGMSFSFDRLDPDLKAFLIKYVPDAVNSCTP